MFINISLINGPNRFLNFINFINYILDIYSIIILYYNYSFNTRVNIFFLIFFALALPYYIII